MASDLRISWRFYAVVAAAAGALALVAALVLRAPSPKPASSVAGAGGRPAPIAFEPLSGATGDEALLRDPTRLFLPTRWNAAQGVRPDRALREPGEAFAGFGAKFVFGENQAELALPSVVVVPEHPAAAIRPSDWQAPFLGLGRTDAMVVPLPARTARLEVRFCRDGRQVVEQELAEIVPFGAQDWQPLEFGVAVAAGGAIGAPALVTSSGVEVVDECALSPIAAVRVTHLGDCSSLAGGGHARSFRGSVIVMPPPVRLRMRTTTPCWWSVMTARP